MFNYTGANNIDYAFLAILINLIVNSFKSIWSIIILGIILVFINKYYRKIVIYNIDKDELEVIYRKKFLKYKRYELDKIEIKKLDIKCDVVKFLKDGKQYKLYIEKTPYLIKNYNISLKKFFYKN